MTGSHTRAIKDSLWVIALTGLVFMASSCSSDDEQSTGEITMAKEPAGEEAASAKTDEASQTSVNSGDIKVVTMNNGAYEDEDEKLAEQDLVIKYWEKMHPGTTLEFQPWQYEPEVFIPKVQSGTSTDIVGLFATEGAMVIQKGLAMDLSPFIEKWDMGQYLIPAILKPYQREGKTFGLPVGDLTGAYVMTLFYNKKLFKE